MFNFCFGHRCPRDRCGKNWALSYQHYGNGDACEVGAVLYFEAENSAYRIHKRIRDMVVFSEHDVNKDPSILEVGSDQLSKSVDLPGE